MAKAASRTRARAKRRSGDMWGTPSIGCDRAKRPRWVGSGRLACGIGRLADLAVRLDRTTRRARRAALAGFAVTVERLERGQRLRQLRPVLAEADEIEQSIRDFVADDVLPAPGFGRGAIGGQREHL